MAALDAGQKSALDGRRDEQTIFLDEDVVDGAFGDFAAKVQEQDIVETRLDSGFEGFSVQRPVGCFVEVHGVLGVGAMGRKPDSRWLGVSCVCGCWQEFTFDLEVTVVVDEKADFAGRFGGLRFLASHPCARKKAHGWGTELLWWKSRGQR